MLSTGTLSINVTPDSVRHYQELLRADWSRQTGQEVLSLLRGLIEDGLNRDESWHEILLLDALKKPEKEFDRWVIDRLRYLSRIFREPALPAMPDEFAGKRASTSAARTEQTWTYLILQALTELDGAIDFFADAQSLLYLCAAHHLLPHLRQKGLTTEHDCLVCAMYIHTLLVWKTQPAHMLQLQQVLMDHLGNSERRLNLLELSFHLTPPDDHAYLTKATAYWSALMELERYQQAWLFLFTLTRHAPDQCQEEIREMQMETIAELNHS